jgi:hypothetical protein
MQVRERHIQRRILIEVRNTIDIMSLQQSGRFEKLDRNTKNILIAVLGSRTAIRQEIRDQTLAVAQLLSRTEVVLINQHNATRALVIDAIQVAETLAGANGQYDPVTGLEKAGAVLKNEEETERKVKIHILEGLKFDTIKERQAEIADAHKNTFAWLFKPAPDSRTNFVEWLHSGRGIYWISGKPGSGKSTLMRYICNSGNARNELLQWAEASQLTICNFFFWNSGTREQRSQKGFLRSLIYDILHQHPALIPIVMPAVWARIYTLVVQEAKIIKPGKFSSEFLMATFRTLVQQTVTPIKLCLFVDGVDECEEETADMTDILTEFATWENVKICLSSRPEAAFQTAFDTSSMLRLQDLTLNDIRLYVADKLHANKRFQEFASRELDRAPSMVGEIVTKADGVFLWVVLVVRSLLVGFANRDEMADLERRLHELPSRLEALFENILQERIAPFYKRQAAELFQTVRASRERNDQIERFLEVPSPLTILALSLTYENAQIDAMNAPIAPLSGYEARILCDTMEYRLMNYCGGLLEVQGTKHGEPGMSRAHVVEPGHKVQYLHRTVKTYLEKPTVWAKIVAPTQNTDFDPNIVLLKSCLRQIKASEFDENRLFSDSTWRCIALGFEYARQAELNQNPAYIPLLDELDSVMAQLLQEPGVPYPGHWATYYEAGHERRSEWEDTTLALAVEYGLSSYIDKKFRQASSTCEKMGRPLLDYAVSRDPTIQRYPMSPLVVSVLLRHGADPNKSYQDATPWENALIYAYLIQFPKLKLSTFGEREPPDRHKVLNLIEIFGHFINYGADLNESCLVRTGIEDETERRPVLFIVNDVFARWYPEESADLVRELKQRGASDEVKSDFTIYRTLAWKRVTSVRVRFWS